MAQAKPEKATVISFAEARKASADAPHDPLTPASFKSGFAETWLKAHEDTQSLVKETLRTKQENAEWERRYNELKPTIAERSLYYVSVLGIVVTLLAWAGVLVMKGL